MNLIRQLKLITRVNVCKFILLFRNFGTNTFACKSWLVFQNKWGEGRGHVDLRPKKRGGDEVRDNSCLWDTVVVRNPHKPFTREQEYLNTTTIGGKELQHH